MVRPSSVERTMNLSGLLDFLGHIEPFADLLEGIQAGKAFPIPLSIPTSARAYVCAAMVNRLARPALVITARMDLSILYAEQLRAWLPHPEVVFLLADPDALPYERVPWSRETRQMRMAALIALAQAQLPGLQVARDSSAPPVVVASARALMQMTIPVRELRSALRVLRRGQRVDLNGLLEAWVGLGYRSVALVEEPGTFSRRGGIVDIWPPNLPAPARLELFGDEVDSLRSFDPSTQRTQAHLDAILIGPATEALPRLGPTARERLAALDLSPCHPPARAEYEQEIDQLVAGVSCRGIEWYLPYLYTHPASPLHHLPVEALLILDDAAEIISTGMDLEGQAERLRRDLTATGELPENALPPYFQWTQLLPLIEARSPIILGYGGLDGRPAVCSSSLARAFASGPRYGGRMRQIVEELEAQRRAGGRLVLITRQAARLTELFGEMSVPVTTCDHIREPPSSNSIIIVPGQLPEGWLLRPERAQTDGDGYSPEPEPFVPLLSLLTDAELFGWSKPHLRRVTRTRAVAPEAFFADVQPGDYVVHMEHGIGIFRGLVKMEVDGTLREYLQVDYAQGDRLYVPVHQADRLSRYVGAADTPPILNRLGTADWNVVKQRAKKAVEDIAEELLRLYAQRELVPGHAFSEDSAWQQELEASFPYVETEDQLLAIEAVKHDMEQPRPMDRLICGDVGYGKTEVALRAAFKAVMDGKQVAVLVPTTVLAQQHYQTFVERLRPFPVNVEMLSRFRSRAEQQKVLEGLAKGSVDIVIGTHRLLSKDVRFKDLGLVIVDEEQRFGVVHKERLKQLRTEVDVLTLTATPIPRTLHMSLTGVRDLSTIDTPPEGRQPIRTMMAEYDETLIRQAILRELDRGGQVFFVHNRVQGIAQIARRLEKLVPEARFAIAHGQMPEKELEEVMWRFANGEVDVLVCTNIIESGLDIPNANTIIINRADHFGLAQLYQLRGRVGRGAVRAYAYLLYDRAKDLTPEARRRLEAIVEASELGAGFRVAMRDLELRGAGELLGTRQHGHIAAIGFDLYCRLLAQAVQEARERMSRNETALNQERADGHRTLLDDPIAPTVSLDLPLAAALPESYVPDASLRLQLYRRMAGLTSVHQVDDMEKELADRFGPLPPEARNLLYQMRVKILAVNAQVQAIAREEGQLVLRSDALEHMDREALQRRLGTRGRVARRAVWMPMREDWQINLLRVLELLAQTR
ncbi:MAG: transcription-repair coupling factor [Anaerolineae bacterium]|nr:transcription-repair coupling factor [Anaerolineae bacterium]MDW8100596.1 transcription-repair coupling factor [Anaerolineae bacterium]